MDSGADDYLVKPFAISEIVTQIEAQQLQTTHVTNNLKIGNVDLCIEKLLMKRSPVNFQGSQDHTDVYV